MGSSALQLHTIELVPEPTGLMPTVPPEIFRRRMAARLLEDAVEAIHRLEQALLADNAGAASAARYHIAAIVASHLHDDELMEKFIQKRNESVAQAKAVQPMRHRAKRADNHDDGGKKK